MAVARRRMSAPGFFQVRSRSPLIHRNAPLFTTSTAMPLLPVERLQIAQCKRKRLKYRHLSRSISTAIMISPRCRSHPVRQAQLPGRTSWRVIDVRQAQGVLREIAAWAGALDQLNTPIPVRRPPPVRITSDKYLVSHGGTDECAGTIKTDRRRQHPRTGVAKSPCQAGPWS